MRWQGRAASTLFLRGHKVGYVALICVFFPVSLWRVSLPCYSLKALLCFLSVATLNVLCCVIFREFVVPLEAQLGSACYPPLPWSLILSITSLIWCRVFSNVFLIFDKRIVWLSSVLGDSI